MVSHMEKYIVDRSFSCIPLQKRYRLCGFPFGKKYRSHFEIVALIVEAIKDCGQAKFSIIKHANINCGQADKFLSSLSQMGFIDQYAISGRPMYRASERGLAFLRQYYTLLSMFLVSGNDTKQPSIVYQQALRPE
jgi:predicted transcriptional regulator